MLNIERRSYSHRHLQIFQFSKSPEIRVYMNEIELAHYINSNVTKIRISMHIVHVRGRTSQKRHIVLWT